MSDGPRSEPGDRCEIVRFGADSGATLASLKGAGVRQVVDHWAARTAEIGARPEVSYVLVTADARAERAHPFGEIYAFREVPPAAAAELNAAPCPMCAEHPGDRLVAESLGWRAWAAANGSWPYSVVLAPMSHRPDLPTLGEWERDALAQLLADVSARLAAMPEGPEPYVLWVHQRPTDGGAWPNAHVHVEISGPPRPLSTGEIGSGVFFNPVAPHAAAARLRQAGAEATP